MTPDVKRRLGLPGVVAITAVLIYLVTVNPWVSLLNLGIVARTSGWLWQPTISNPLTFVLLFPFRILPPAWIPLALNLFTALCSALVLALLVRCVSLLPYDIAPPRPPVRERPLFLLTGPFSWIPPTLSAIALGLQLTFWEHATSATGEMIDLLLFAYIARCLFEFRVDQDQSWLSRSALLYGLGMVNNWAMIGYFPVYLAALLRLKGLGPFLAPRFLVRMTCWGLLGLSFYLVLPIAHLFNSHADWGFWATLKAHLKLQKEAVSVLRIRSFQALAMVSLLPLLVLSVRWKSHTIQFADDTRVGVFLTKAMVHFVHAMFLLASCWVMFDPSFSPRHLHLGIPALTFYFGSALVFGYCAGHFLLLGSAGGPKWLPQAARLSLGCLLLGLPLLLGWKNLGPVRLTNGNALRQFTALVDADLPPGKSIVLSDEPVQLLLLRAELARHPEKEVMPVDTASLAAVRYHSLLAKRHPGRWPALGTNTQSLSVSEIVALIKGLTTQEPVFYLHPLFGVFSEHFNAQPHGFIQQLTVNAGFTDSDLRRNEERWRDHWAAGLKDLAAARSISFVNHAFTWIGSAPEDNAARRFVAGQCSRALNQWGVSLQRQEHWAEAGVWFQRAVEIDSQNRIARINSEYNGRRQRGDRTRLEQAEATAAMKQVMVRHANWQEAIRLEGPFDEPSLALRVGKLFLSSGQERQAAREFLRAAELDPDWAAARLWLSEALISLGQFQRALEQVDTALNQPGPLTAERLSQTLLCKAGALTRLGRTNDAEAFVQDLVANHGKYDELLATASDFYEQNKLYERQITTLEELLKRKPNESSLLVKRGQAELNLRQYDAAIATLSKALAVTPGNDEARLYRAVAQLSAGQLEGSRVDYEQLLQKSAHSQNALFGLGAIAWRKGDTNAAIGFYQRYLSRGSPRSAQYAVATERLHALKPDSKAAE